MFILVESIDGDQYVVKRADIRRVYEQTAGTVISFASPKNGSIFVKETVKEFYEKYMEK